MKHDPYRWRDTRRTILRCWPYLGYKMVACTAVALFLILYWALVSAIRHLVALTRPDIDLLVVLLAGVGLIWLSRRLMGHLVRVRAGFAALLAIRRDSEWPSFTSQVRFASRAVKSRFESPRQVETVLKLLESSLQEIDRNQQVPAAFFPLRSMGRWRWFRRTCAWIAARPLADALLSYHFRSGKSAWGAAADGIQHFVRDRSYLLAVATGFQAVDVLVSDLLLVGMVAGLAMPASAVLPVPFDSLGFLVPVLMLWVFHHSVVMPIHVTMLTLAMEKRRSAAELPMPITEAELEALSPSYGELQFLDRYSEHDGMNPFTGNARLTLGRRPVAL